jgi:hypothetical protein
LDEIVERFTAMVEPPRAVDGHPAVFFDQRIAQRAVTSGAPPAEASVDGLLWLVRSRRCFMWCV